MIIAMASNSKDENAVLDNRFGRAKYLALYHTQDKIFSYFQNTVSLGSVQGAGVQAAQMVVDSDAKALVTANCGPKAFKVLSAAGVQIYKSEAKKLSEIINLYNQNKLERMEDPNVKGHGK